MKTKQIFSIMVLVGIAFAGIAFAGPSGLPTNPSSSVPAPITVNILPPCLDVCSSSSTDTIGSGSPLLQDIGYFPQAKQGSTGVVPNTLSLGVSSFPTTNQTLYVNGGLVVGSTILSSDPLLVNSNMQLSGNLTINSVTYGSGVEKVKIGDLMNGVYPPPANPRPVCISAPSGSPAVSKIVVCQ